VCRARQIVTLVLLAGFVVACGQAAAPPTPGDSADKIPPTYTPYPTYTLYPTYTPPPPTIDVESLVWPNGPQDDVISWADAADFLGSEMIVEGTVVRAHNSGDVVFLNFAEDYQGTFRVVIFPEDWGKFPRSPEMLFYGRQIRVQGPIELYQEAPEIVVRDPWQIEVALTLGQQEACDCGTPAIVEVVITATPSARDEQPAATSELVEPTAEVEETQSASKIVGWQDAAAFVGESVTVEGLVVNTYNSGNVVFLNFDEDYVHTFKVVIFPDAWPLFPQPPEEMYRGQLLQVTGQVEMYQGAPEIIVETPGAIEILE
jgi:DNA/RNA endonuclease YhcR with UshA esterase domain